MTIPPDLGRLPTRVEAIETRVTASTVPSRKEPQMFFELRQYSIRPGKKDEWVRMMEDEIIPFQQSQGMVIVGSFTGEEDESVYVWVRRFDSEEERERLYEAVYQSDHWKNDIGPRIPDLMDRDKINVQRIEPTKLSALR
jgi:hypothetical protein